MQVELIPVSKNGDYLEVHPTTLANHKALGWVECEKREENSDEDGKGEKKPSEGLNVAQLKEALAAKNIAIPEGAVKADLVKLLDEAPV